MSRNRDEMVTVPAWHLWQMSAAIMGATPDHNTQTPEQVSETEDVLHALATIYCPYSTHDGKEHAQAVLSAIVQKYP